MKCFSFKEVSKNVRTVVYGQPDPSVEEEKNLESDFCRINPQNSFTFVSKTLHGFVVGPHSLSDIGGK